MKFKRVPEIDKTLEYLESNGYSTLHIAKILGLPRDLIYNYKAGKGFIRERDYTLLKELAGKVEIMKEFVDAVDDVTREESKVLNADHVNNALIRHKSGGV